MESKNTSILRQAQDEKILINHGEPVESIKFNIPLHDKNWFGTGGPARYFAEPKTNLEFQQAVTFAHQNSLPIFVLGQGANILISDEGYPGLVIRPQLKEITAEEHGNEVHITVGAGLSVHDLIEWCLNHNLIGLEEFSGIPGTVGGSVYINLHYYEFLLSHFFLEGTVIEKNSGAILTVPHSWFNFGYNQSTLHDENHYLVSAKLHVKKVSDVEIAYARGRRREIIRHRETRYPKKNTCGSFFRNFHTEEVTLMSGDKKLIWVAYYLDKVGVKGALRVGNAIVSHQHANMLVNLGWATSTDIIMLARQMQELVQQHFGIVPQPECRLIGFAEYPLLPSSCEK